MAHSSANNSPHTDINFRQLKRPEEKTLFASSLADRVATHPLLERASNFAQANPYLYIFVVIHFFISFAPLVCYLLFVTSITVAAHAVVLSLAGVAFLFFLLPVLFLTALITLFVFTFFALLVLGYHIAIDINHPSLMIRNKLKQLWLCFYNLLGLHQKEHIIEKSNDYQLVGNKAIEIAKEEKVVT